MDAVDGGGERGRDGVVGVGHRRQRAPLGCRCENAQRTPHRPAGDRDRDVGAVGPGDRDAGRVGQLARPRHRQGAAGVAGDQRIAVEAEGHRAVVLEASGRPHDGGQLLRQGVALVDELVGRAPRLERRADLPVQGRDLGRRGVDVGDLAVDLGAQVGPLPHHAVVARGDLRGQHRGVGEHHLRRRGLGGVGQVGPARPEAIEVRGQTVFRRLGEHGLALPAAAARVDQNPDADSASRTRASSTSSPSRAMPVTV